VRRVPAAEIEAAVIDQLRGMLRSPEVIVATWRAARSGIEGLSEDDVREALERLDPVWDELFPAEQARIVQLLVARVDVAVDGIEIHLRTQGLTSTFRQLADIGAPQEAAA
jgi:site-specific DNA recombinase